MNPSRKNIVAYLSSLTSKAGFIDRIKIKYRPLICPFDLLLTYANDKKSVFDIGCGSGQFCALIAHFTDAKEIHGIEIDARLVKNAQEITKTEPHKKILFHVFNGKQLPNDIQHYEIVYLIDVLHHIPKPDQEKFLLELHNKLGANSVLVIKDIDSSHPFVIFNKIHDLIFSGQIGHEKSYTQLKKTLLQLGFQIKESFKKTVFLYPHYFFVCIKK